MATTLTTKQVARVLRMAAKSVDLAVRYRPDRSAADTCKLIGQALSEIQDAEIVLKNDECWRARTEADMRSIREREARS